MTVNINILSNKYVQQDATTIGNDGEQNVTTLVFDFPSELDGFVPYIEINADGEEHFDIIFDRSYTLGAGMTRARRITCQVVFRDAEKAVWKSNEFEFRVNKSLGILEKFDPDNPDEILGAITTMALQIQEMQRAVDGLENKIETTVANAVNTALTEVQNQIDQKQPLLVAGDNIIITRNPNNTQTISAVVPPPSGGGMRPATFVIGNAARGHTTVECDAVVATGANITTTLNTARTSLGANGGKILIREGEYVQTTVFTINTAQLNPGREIVVEGMGNSTIIRRTQSSLMFDCSTLGGSVRLYSMQISNGTQNVSAAMMRVSGANVLIENCLIDVPNSVIETTGTSNLENIKKIRGCDIRVGNIATAAVATARRNLIDNVNFAQQIDILENDILFGHPTNVFGGAASAQSAWYKINHNNIRYPGMHTTFNFNAANSQMCNNIYRVATVSTSGIELIGNNTLIAQNNFGGNMMWNSQNPSARWIDNL